MSTVGGTAEATVSGGDGTADFESPEAVQPRSMSAVGNPADAALDGDEETLTFENSEPAPPPSAPRHIVAGWRNMMDKKYLQAAVLLKKAVRGIPPGTRVAVTENTLRTSDPRRSPRKSLVGHVEVSYGGRRRVSRQEISVEADAAALAGLLDYVAGAGALVKWLTVHAPPPTKRADRARWACDFLASPSEVTMLYAALGIALHWPERAEHLSHPVLIDRVQPDCRYLSGLRIKADRTTLYRRQVVPVVVDMLVALSEDDSCSMERTPLSFWSLPSSNETLLSGDTSSLRIVAPYLFFLATNGRSSVDTALSDLLACAYLAAGNMEPPTSPMAHAPLQNCMAVFGGPSSARVRRDFGRALQNYAVADTTAAPADRAKWFLDAMDDEDLQDDVTAWANVVRSRVRAGLEREEVVIPVYGRVHGVRGIVDALTQTTTAEDNTLRLPIFRDDERAKARLEAAIDPESCASGGAARGILSGIRSLFT